MNRPHRLARLEFGKALWGQRPTPTHDKPQSPLPPGRSLAAGFLYLLFAYSAFLAGTPSHAATRYVNLANPAPATPYTSWATAATNIQHAIDAAMAGDEILVTNGVYQTGATAVYGMSNRVAVTTPVTVQSVNGPSVTLIEGFGPNGSNAVRCVYLTTGAVLAGFTLTNGATQTTGDLFRNRSGGGVWCESTNAVVTNCVLTGNSAAENGGGTYGGTLSHCTLVGNLAHEFGGGVHAGTLNHCTLVGNSANDFGGGACEGTLSHCTLTGNSAWGGGGTSGGTLNHCALTGNSARWGGGAAGGTLYNCTLTGNSATYGGGASGSTLKNCIVYYNTARIAGSNSSGGALDYCCTTPLPSSGMGNIGAEPQLAGNWHLNPNSPCRGAGSAAYANGLDLDGEPWANPPSIGCDEYWNGSVTGALSAALVAAYTNVAVGFAVDFQALIDGRVSASRWDFGDGIVVSNRLWASHAWTAAGDYLVELRAFNESYPSGVSTTVTVRVVPALPVHYVSLASANPLPPYDSWATAATNIQDAIFMAVAGDLILVTNGVYETGAREVYGMSNRVAVTKPVTVRSVNGPEVTIIAGYQVPGTANGPSAIRCVYLTNGAVLAGFTLTNGATQASGNISTNQSGGGVWCESTNAVVTNCVLAGNSAFFYGGGAYSGALDHCTLTGNSAFICGGGVYSGTLNHCTLTGNSARTGGGVCEATLNHCTLTGNSAGSGGGAYLGTLNNCTLTGNSAGSGGGAYLGTLNNCTLTGNSATYGGGAYEATLNNCIAYYNTAQLAWDNYSRGTLNHSCTTPLPTSGTGNIVAEPQLAGNWHLNASSPCRGAGSAAYANALDLDGEPWANPPSIGCDEYWSGSVTGALSAVLVAAYTNVAVGFAVDFQSVIDGRVSASRWDFGDGLVVSNRPYAAHAWAAAGQYVAEFRAYNESYPAGIAITVTVWVVDVVHHVALSSPNPVPPYTSWATAATNIQDAVEAAALPGALVLVSNGVYQTGATAVYGMSNRVAVTKPLMVQSVNGPEVTIIAGYRVPGTTNGPAAVRCVYLTNGAVLAGFTLANGATQTSGDYDRNQSGGGVWCETPNAVVTNCALVGNSASYSGGGAYRGTLNHCTLTGNSATGNYGHGGGTYAGTLNHCTLTGNSADSGGGAYSGALNHCTLTGNSASYGGGAYAGTLNHCTLTGNSADSGGGAYSGTLNHCTLTGNSASLYGGGAFSDYLAPCALNNCIVYYNSVQGSGNNYDANFTTLNYCCTVPLPSSGTGNLTNAPLFTDTNGWSNLRLHANSPCINAGNNAYAAGDIDLDGNPRIAGGQVDIGAYEFQTPGSVISYAWLQGYSLPTDGSADDLDADRDGHNNWQEWQADTDPTNAGSVLRLGSIPAGPSVTVEFSPSSLNRRYTLLSATNLDAAPWTSVPGQTEVPGTGGWQTLRDTNAAPPRFYRVQVVRP